MKSKNIFIVMFAVVLIIFSLGIVKKQIHDGDTFWYISIGEYIINTNSIDGFDHWTFHENLKYPYQRIFSLFSFLLRILFYGIYRHIYNDFGSYMFDYNNII